MSFGRNSNKINYQLLKLVKMLLIKFRTVTVAVSKGCTTNNQPQNTNSKLTFALAI